MEGDGEAQEFAQLIATQSYVQPAALVLHGEQYIIGRAAECDIVVRQKSVSREHARIERRSRRYIVSDNDSINGTFVNGQRLFAARPLQDGDTIGIGAPTGMLSFHDPDPTDVSASSLRYDPHSRCFYIGRRRVELSVQLTRLLAHLYEYAGEICNNESCAQAIWGAGFDESQLATVDRVIKRLRDGLHTADPKANLIENKRGEGYKLNIS